MMHTQKSTACATVKQKATKIGLNIQEKMMNLFKQRYLLTNRPIAIWTDRGASEHNTNLPFFIK